MVSQYKYSGKHPFQSTLRLQVLVHTHTYTHTSNSQKGIDKQQRDNSNKVYRVELGGNKIVSFKVCDLNYVWGVMKIIRDYCDPTISPKLC